MRRGMDFESELSAPGPANSAPSTQPSTAGAEAVRSRSPPKAAAYERGVAAGRRMESPRSALLPSAGAFTVHLPRLTFLASWKDEVGQRRRDFNAEHGA